MEFKPGEFRKFRTTSNIHLGEISKDIPENTIVEYDGQILKWAGQDFSLPSLRAGIKIGWLVPAEDNVTHYVPQPANVRVRPATSAGDDRGEPMQMERASEDLFSATLLAQWAERVEEWDLLEAAVALWPEDPYLMFLRARAREQMISPEAALPDLKAFVARYPFDPSGWLVLAKCLERTGDDEGALDADQHDGMDG